MSHSSVSPLSGSILRNAGCGLLLTCLAGFALPPATARAEQVYQAWQELYNTDAPAGHSGNATTTDSRGNVIVTGFAGVQNGFKQFYTAKYAAVDGSVIWSRVQESSTGDCVGNAVAVDSEDNVIVTGRTAGSGNNADYYTVKYGGGNGDTIWERTYAGPQGGLDQATKIVLDHEDNVIVAGTSYGNGTQEDWFLIKYTSALGLPQWGGNNGGLRVNGSSNSMDVPAALAVDKSNNVYATGRVVQGGKSVIYTIKLSPGGSVLWGVVQNTGATGDSEPTGLAVNSEGESVVTAITRDSGQNRSGYTVEYDSTSKVLWSAALNCGMNNYTGGPVGVGFDAQGDVLIAATTKDSDVFSTTHLTAVKYAGAGNSSPGSVLWSVSSASPDHTDTAVALKVDAVGNAVVTGTSNDPTNHAEDIYTAKFAALDGKLMSDFRYDGSGATDVPHDLALDDFGNAIVTGSTSLYYANTGIRYNRIFTAKYSRLRVSTGDDAPGAGEAGSGIPAGAKVVAISTPALANTGDLAVKITIAKGNLRLSAILKQSAGGVNRILALQGQPAAGAGGGSYASFLDPVIAPEGRVAFSGKLTSVPAAQSTGVWITDGGGNVLRKLQSGTQVPNLDAGLLLRSVAAISWRNQDLVAQIQVSGTGVTVKNATILYGLHAVFGGNVILRTGDSFTLPNQAASTIQAISAFTPAAGSPGQGRSFASTSLAVKVTLASKAVAQVRISIFGGAPTVLEYTGGSAPVANNASAKWKTLGLPALGSGNANFVTTGTLQLSAPGVMPKITAQNDQVIAFSTNGSNFSVVAREGDKDDNGDQFGPFLDPLVNDQGKIAFIGSLGGAGVNPHQRTALWSGDGSVPPSLHIVAQLGTPAPEPSGGILAVHPPLYSAFLSTALPGGPEGGPILLAKIAGPGVTVKNNVGVWAVDRTGLMRNLLRTGQAIGAHKVAAISLLQPTSGALGVTRSFDEAGSVEALVSFTDHTSAVLHLAIP